MRFIPFLLLFIMFGCASQKPTTNPSPEVAVSPTPKPKSLEVYEIGPDKETALTRQNLYQVIQIYDLARFLYTYRVKIQEGVSPLSHPILTLNTRYAQSPNKIMAQWLHQQFHWWANSRPRSVWRAIADLQKIYPKVPGKTKEEIKQSYLHLIINYLEFRTMGKLIGYTQTHRIINEMLKDEDHYGWAYQQVFRNPAAIRKILRKHRLIPTAIH